MAANILITGGAGYLGSLLAPTLLTQEHKVTILDLPEKWAAVQERFQESIPQIINNGNFNVITDDLVKTKTLERLIPESDVIIPLAAIVGAPACDKIPDVAKQINLGHIEVINRVRSRHQRVLFPMTNNGYVTRPGEDFADESSPFNTDSLYTLTKFQAEQALLNKGNAISIRLASLFGFAPAIRWDLLVHFYIRTALRDARLSIFEPHFKRSFVHAADAADCFVHSLNHFEQMKNNVFNLASEEANISKFELAKLIQRRLPGLNIELDESTKDPDARNVFIKTDKLLKAGFKAKRTLDQGISEVLNLALINQGAAA